MTMGKQMKNNNKFHIFLLLLRKNIGLQVVQDRRVVNGGVTTFIPCMYKFFVEKKTFLINPQHQHFGFVATLIFQQIV
jgi:hypothetical protein